VTGLMCVKNSRKSDLNSLVDAVSRFCR